jgi:hypothetical protein
VRFQTPEEPLSAVRHCGPPHLLGVEYFTVFWMGKYPVESREGSASISRSTERRFTEIGAVP